MHKTFFPCLWSGALQSTSRREDLQIDVMRDDLLGAQRNRNGFFGWKRECFIQRICMKGLRSTEYSGKSLDRNTNNIVVGLLSRQGTARGLRMETEQPGSEDFWL